MMYPLVLFLISLSWLISLATSGGVSRDYTTDTTTVASSSLPETAMELVLEKPVPDRLLFVGDVMLARDVDLRSKRAGTTSHPFARLSFSNLPIYIIGNFEGTIPPSYAMTPPFTFAFAAPSSTAPMLRAVGFTHLSLANNHSLDYGSAGHTNTRRVLNEAGIAVGGHATTMSSTSVAYLETKSGTVALVFISTVGATPSSTALKTFIEEVSEQSEFQIVYIHWGDEYALTHSSAQAALARTLIGAGTDLIIGHHPHVVQDIDFIDGVPVIYSLGNFVFDQYFSRTVEEGLVAVVDFGAATVRLYPVTSHDARTQPRYMTSVESVDFLTRLAKRSDRRWSSQIQNGVLPLRLAVATSTKVAMIAE